MYRPILLASMIAIMAGPAAVSKVAAFPVHEIGYGVRSMGFAGNVTGLADDPSAAYWNPGGLSFLTQREAFASLGYIAQTNDAMVKGNEYEKMLMRIRFFPTGILYPVPAERGGLALSFSVNNAFNFDDILSYSDTRINDQGASAATESDYRMYGGLNFCTFAGGIQVGPGVGVGIAVSLITGSESARYHFLQTIDGEVFDTLNDDFYDRYERTYFGVDIRGGLLYRPSQNLRLGVRAVIPRWISFAESIRSIAPSGSGKETFEDVEGTLYSSYEGAVGAAYEIESLIFTADIRGRLPYLLLQPIEDIPAASDAAHVRIGMGCGIEFPLVGHTLIGRTAYSFDEYDTHRFVQKYDGESAPDFSKDPSEPQIHNNSLAAGFSLNFSLVSLDFGYKFGWWRLLTNSIIQETHLQHQAQVALSWRF